MRVSRRVVFAVAGSIMAASALTACGGGSTAKGNADGVLKVGMPNGPQTDNNNPFLSSSAGASLGYRRMIFEPLTMWNSAKPADKAKPWLATDWSWSADYKTLNLTTRDNVKWSDGQAFSADDVAYTFNLLKSTPALNNNGIKFGDITTSGANKLTVTFPTPQFVNQVKILSDIPIVAKHQWSSISDPATDPVKQPVGTGPYTLKSFTPQTVTLDVRDSYWQDLPKVKEIQYTSYTDNNAQTTALATGACEWSFVFIPNYKAVYTSKDPAHYQIYFPPSLGVHGLWFNTTKAPYDDPTLRQAISMVINRDDIFNQGEAGYFYPAVTSPTGIPTPAGDSFIAPDYKGQTVKVDVAGAKAKLTAAGYTYDGNTLKDKTGKPVTLNLSDPAGWSDYQTDLEIIKDNVSKIGITATVDKANQDTWTKDIDTGTFDSAMHWTDSGATPYQMYASIMDGALYKPVGTPGVNGNYGRFQNQQATDALNTYVNATDDATRATALNQIQKIMVEQQPMIPTSAANVGGEYSTKNWVGWPSLSDEYAPGQPTLINAEDIVLHLRPAS